MGALTCPPQRTAHRLMTLWTGRVVASSAPRTTSGRRPPGPDPFHSRRRPTAGGPWTPPLPSPPSQSAICPHAPSSFSLTIAARRRTGGGQALESDGGRVGIECARRGRLASQPARARRTFCVGRLPYFDLRFNDMVFVDNFYIVDHDKKPHWFMCAIDQVSSVPKRTAPTWIHPHAITFSSF